LFKFSKKWIVLYKIGYSEVATHLDSPLPFTIPSWIIVKALKIIHDRKLKFDANSRMDSINDIPQHQLIHRALSSKQKKSSKSTRNFIYLTLYVYGKIINK
jgi:hypothetical protein